MTRRIQITPQARLDLVEHFAFIAEDKLLPAERFLAAAQKLIAQLSEMPTIGREWESPYVRHAGVRVCPMPSPYRKYLVFYRFNQEELEVIRVIHGARDLERVL
jgi:toxin ParE1/3/4